MHGGKLIVVYPTRSTGAVLDATMSPVRLIFLGLEWRSTEMGFPLFHSFHDEIYLAY
jgi:hypothetical protein